MIVDQLTFGDKVHSPDAVNVPVKLAVSLLEDWRGVIDVELPVSGSLDDPDFNVWRAMQKELRDRVVAAATAPFSYIARAFGGSDELAYVTFPAGLARLDDKGRNKLATLAKALHERPQLSFEIQGGTDPERDREGLRRDLFERTSGRRSGRSCYGRERGVGRRRRGALRRERAAAPVAAAYKAETFPKPAQRLRTHQAPLARGDGEVDARQDQGRERGAARSRPAPGGGRQGGARPAGAGRRRAPVPGQSAHGQRRQRRLQAEGRLRRPASRICGLAHDLRRADDCRSDPRALRTTRLSHPGVTRVARALPRYVTKGGTPCCTTRWFFS